MVEIPTNFPKKYKNISCRFGCLDEEGRAIRDNYLHILQCPKNKFSNESSMMDTAIDTNDKISDLYENNPIQVDKIANKLIQLIQLREEKLEALTEMTEGP